MNDTPENATYPDRWADPINETYAPEGGDVNDCEADDFLHPDDYLDGEDERTAEKRILTKAAQCLRNGIPATFTAGELDVVRHLMPAHEVHQSGAVRWVLDTYGPTNTDDERLALTAELAALKGEVRDKVARLETIQRRLAELEQAENKSAGQ